MATASSDSHPPRPAAVAEAPVWRAEPFRVFFPLGVLLAWVGISHWLLYGLGITGSYSCALHGLVQMQAFMIAFALGFLLTAIPRRTQSAPPTAAEMAVFVGLLIVTAAAAATERWFVAEVAYAAVFLTLLRFASRRLAGSSAGRRPPAAFVLIPIGVLHGVAGAALIAATAAGAAAWMMELGKLLVEQGVFLCLIVGVGSLVLPLIGGAPPPPDLDASPRERRKALAYAACGVAIFATLLLEHAGWVRLGPLLRALVVGSGLALGGGALQAPRKPGFHRRLVWISVWLTPLGLAAAGLWPDYRVPALHILFIGGFSLMAFAVATHVSLAHLGLEELALGRPPAVVVLAVAFLLALGARLVADASDSYFGHLTWAATSWLIGSAVWLGFFVPRFLRSR